MLKLARSSLLEDTNYDLDRNDSRNVLSRCSLNFRDFPTNYISNCSIRSRLSTYQVFSSVTLKSLASCSSKMHCEAMK